MRSERWKALLAVCMAAVMLVLSACGGNGQTQEQAEEQPEEQAEEQAEEMTEEELPEEAAETEAREIAFFSSELAYDAQEVTTEEDIDLFSLNGLAAGGGRIVSLKTYQDENGFLSGPYVLVSVDEEGQDYREDQVEIPELDILQTWCLDEKGQLYCVTASFAQDGADDEDTGLIYQLYSVDPDGEVRWVRELKPSGDEEESGYVPGSLCAADGRILLSDDYGISSFKDEDGTLVTDFAPEKALTDGQLFHSAGGRTLLAGYAGGELYVSEIDAAGGKAGDPVLMPGGQRFNGLFAGTDCDLLLAGPTGIYSYTSGQDPVKIIDYYDSDLWVADLAGLVEVSGDSDSLVAMMQVEDGDRHLMVLSPAGESGEETILMTLGGYHVDDAILKQIYLFNLENEGIRIGLREYSELYPDEGPERLRTDVKNGQGPDILYLSPNMDCDGFLKNSVLSDLQPMIDGDQALSQVGLLESVLAGYRRGKALYAVTPKFDITAMAASAGKYASADKLTLSALQEQIKKDGITSAGAFGGMTRDAFLLYAIEMAGRKFVDSQAGTCSFDQESFREILSFAATITEENSDPEEGEIQYRAGKAVLYPDIISDFLEYGYLKQTLFGTDIVLAGFPLDGTTEAVFSGQTPMGIDRRSPLQEEAWSFIRRFFTEDYQAAEVTGWPVSLEALRDRAADAQQPFYEEDENGNLTETEYYEMVGDEEILRTPLTEQETTAYIDWLGGLSQRIYYDDDVLRIVFTESDKFFAGQTSAEDCAAEIQKQVSAYLQAQ